nr:hypothetical protein BCU13_15605 [Vibrio lentus]
MPLNDESLLNEQAFFNVVSEEEFDAAGFQGTGIPAPTLYHVDIFTISECKKAVAFLLRLSLM